MNLNRSLFIVLCCLNITSIIGMSKKPYWYWFHEQWSEPQLVYTLTDNKKINVTRTWNVAKIYANNKNDLQIEAEIKYGSYINLGIWQIPNLITDYQFKPENQITKIGFKDNKKEMAWTNDQITFDSIIEYEQPWYENPVSTSNGSIIFNLIKIVFIKLKAYSVPNNHELVQFRFYPKYGIAIGIEAIDVPFIWFPAVVSEEYHYILYCVNLDDSQQKLNLTKLCLFKLQKQISITTVKKIFFAPNGKSIFIILLNGEIYEIKVQYNVEYAFSEFINHFDMHFKYSNN